MISNIIFYPMIKDKELFKRFEEKFISSQKLNYFQNLKIFEGLFSLAKRYKVFPLQNPLEGIEKDIELSRCLRGLSKRFVKNLKKKR